ncbi:hypothetical protein GCM10023213_28300 [Prosthecobacter algae]|uniref:Uncharacterized protein n=1 Tax=Prosthecobacter algae TaxID=1144682 RepID=A0ABP9P8L8_9BACT
MPGYIVAFKTSNRACQDPRDGPAFDGYNPAASVLKGDRAGRVQTPVERQIVLVDVCEISDLSGPGLVGLAEVVGQIGRLAAVRGLFREA